MTTFYTATLPFLLFALASNALTIRMNNGTSVRSEEPQRLLVTKLESMRTEIENSKVTADHIYEKILTKLSEFNDKKSDEIFDDLNEKRLAFHVFREENSIDKNPNCLELIGRLGRSANDAVATINECAIQLSETVEEYLDDFDETVAAKLKRLNASKIAAQKCLDSDNNDLIKSCIRDAWNTKSYRDDALHSSAIHQQKKLLTLLDKLETNMVSCSFDRCEAYYSLSSTFFEEVRNCI